MRKRRRVKSTNIGPLSFYKTQKNNNMGIQIKERKEETENETGCPAIVTRSNKKEMALLIGNSTNELLVGFCVLALVVAKS